MTVSLLDAARSMWVTIATHRFQIAWSIKCVVKILYQHSPEKKQNHGY